MYRPGPGHIPPRGSQEHIFESHCDLDALMGFERCGLMVSFRILKCSIDCAVVKLRQFREGEVKADSGLGGPFPTPDPGL